MTIPELLNSSPVKQNPKEDFEALLRSCSNPASWSLDSVTGMALALLVSQNVHRLVSPEDYDRLLMIIQTAITKYRSLQTISKPQYMLYRTVESRRALL